MATESESNHGDSKRARKNAERTHLTDDDSTEMPHLMPEIMVEVLARLPVKSLCRFRCACKHWRSLISDPHFIKKHLHMSIADDSYSNHRLLFICLETKFSFKCCTIYSLFNREDESSVGASEFRYPVLKRLYHYDRIVGSCNGLLCIVRRRDTVRLWNPATNESRKFKVVGLIERFKRSIRSYTVYGFGYDYSNDDYKVLVILCYVGNGGAYETEVDVYSLKTNSWRRIQGFPSGSPLNDPGKYVSGALNWAVGSGLSWKIVALDLANETYREVLQPIYGDNKCPKVLGVLRGDLCVHCYNLDSRTADIWVMKEYGVSESWIKLFTLRILSYGSCSFSPYNPLFYSKYDELLLDYYGRLLLYNTRKNGSQYPRIRNFERCREVDVYVESLVSPNPSIELSATP